MFAVVGAGVAPATEPAGSTQFDPAQTKAAVQWLATLAVNELPAQFDGDKDWDRRKKVWAGVKVRFDDFKLKTHRRYRELRHGRWVRYQLTLPKQTVPLRPDASEAVTINVSSVEQLANGRWRIGCQFNAPLNFDVRVERWNLGVQWFSVNVIGDARVRLDVVATIGFLTDYTEIPPALSIDPRIESAHLHLDHFEVNKISKLGGDVAEELGELVEEILEEVWLKRENERLADRINRKIDQRRADLRWSFTDWLSR